MDQSQTILTWNVVQMIMHQKNHVIYARAAQEFIFHWSKGQRLQLLLFDLPG